MSISFDVDISMIRQGLDVSISFDVDISMILYSWYHVDSVSGHTK